MERRIRPTAAPTSPLYQHCSTPRPCNPTEQASINLGYGDRPNQSLARIIPFSRAYNVLIWNVHPHGDSVPIVVAVRDSISKHVDASIGQLQESPTNPRRRSARMRSANL